MNSPNGVTAISSSSCDVRRFFLLALLDARAGDHAVVAVCELITADTEYIACCHTGHCGVRVGVLQLV